MSKIPTPHNMADKGEIAKTVLMPGDPLRAKFIAEHYLSDVVCFNTVRNMFGFTGTYEGKRISVMGSGMGIPSIGIYSYELFHFYDVDSIIRIGSAGGLSNEVKLRDLVIAMGTCTNSAYLKQFKLSGTFAPIADYELLSRSVTVAKQKNISVKVGNVLSSDIFYMQDHKDYDSWRDMGVLCVEMESAGLYSNAAAAGKKAVCLLTISDHLYTGEALSAEQRQTSFQDMMEVALCL